MLTCVESVRDIAGGAGSTDPDTGLRAVAALQVDNARKLDWSWQEIAGRLGATKQTVHRKHGKRTRRR
jgi:hypothetical protein